MLLVARELAARRHEGRAAAPEAGHGSSSSAEPVPSATACSAALRSYTSGGLSRDCRVRTATRRRSPSRAPPRQADAPRSVYLATGASFPDGLAGTPAAARAGGPLLIVPPAGSRPSVAEELRRLNPSRVVILGGPSVVSSTVAAQVAALWD